MSQNGFDNGGISGVCKWAQLPDEVEFVLSVLERLARRYGHRRALMGIEIINEPNTTTCWPMANVTERYKAVDPELAEGTGPIAFDWLKELLHHRLPPSARRRQGRAADGQGRGVPRRLRHRAVEGLHARVRWQACAGIRERGPRHPPAPHDRRNDGLPADRGSYDDFVRNTYAPMIAEMSEYFPVIVGEWCLFNSVAAAWTPTAAKACSTARKARRPRP